jgi:hypothetical protein
MPITTGCKPVFSETKSKLLFYKNQFPYLPSLTEVRDTLKWLRAVKARNKLSGHTDDLAVPAGSHYPLDNYTSVEYLLPQAYGIGERVLPANVTDERKGQAKQLQAYLLLFDQLLADFFSQLDNAKESVFYRGHRANLLCTVPGGYQKYPTGIQTGCGI